MRKPRCDSPLKALPEIEQAQIAELIIKEGFLAAVPEVKRLTGLRTGISVSALHRFYSWYKVSHALEANRDDAQAFEELLKGNPDIQLDAEKARLVGQLHFERRILASDDPELYFAWLKERRAEEELLLDREKLSLERDKFERLVMDRLDDLVAARSAAQAKGLDGDAMVAAVRTALWGPAA
jgi:hypothetical protein